MRMRDTHTISRDVGAWMATQHTGCISAPEKCSQFVSYKRSYSESGTAVRYHNGTWIVGGVFVCLSVCLLSPKNNDNGSTRRDAYRLPATPEITPRTMRAY